jgi:hypothetical protein
MTVSLYRLVKEWLAKSAKTDLNQPLITRDEADKETVHELAGPEYAFARKSKISNKGEDVARSARHKVNEWKGLADAETAGTAESSVTRDKLLKLSPPDLASKVNDTNWPYMLGLHFALAHLPSKPTVASTIKATDPKQEIWHEYGAPRYEGVKPRNYWMKAGMKPSDLDANKVKTWTMGDAQQHARKRFVEMFDSFKQLAEQKAQQNMIVDPEGKATTPESPGFVITDSNHSLAEAAISRLKWHARDEYQKIEKEGQSQGRFGAPDMAHVNGLIHYYNNVSHPHKRDSARLDVEQFWKNMAEKHGPDWEKTSAPLAAQYTKQLLAGKRMVELFGRPAADLESKSRFNAAEAYVAHAERVGPQYQMPTAEHQTNFLLGGAKMRGLQWGNSVSDAEREHHLYHTAHALKDLTQLLGLPDQMASINGRLALAIGARGTGRALAHYEPKLRVINLTRKGGVGSLAHEWAHAFDNLLFGVASGKYEGKERKDEPWHTGYLSDMAYSWKHHDNPHTRAIAEPMDSIVNILHQQIRPRMNSDVQKQNLDARMGANWRSYWFSTKEMLARAFEQYVGQKMKANGLHNTYLTGVTAHPLWPNEEETAKLTPLFDKLFDAFKHSDYLHKSTQWHVKIKGREGYHPVHKIQDMGAGQGNHYILESGERVPQAHIEDLSMGKPAEGLGKGWRPKFNPMDVPLKEHDTVSGWLGGHMSRQTRGRIPEMSPEMRARALHRVGSRTQVRINANGEREFLLHRGMSNEERGKTVGKSRVNHAATSSWTTDYDKAQFFGGEQPVSPKNVRGKGGVVSAWINEKNIRHVPFMLGGDLRYHMQQTGRAHPVKSRMHDEMEIIVNPNHKSELGKYTPPPPAYRDLNARINVRSELGLGIKNLHALEPQKKSEDLPGRLRKAVEQFLHTTAGRHPASPATAAKPAADPGTPPNIPHIREDTMTEVNLKTEHQLRKSRASLEFPKLGIATRQGQNVQTVQTPRQYEIMRRLTKIAYKKLGSRPRAAQAHAQHTIRQLREGSMGGVALTPVKRQPNVQAQGFMSSESDPTRQHEGNHLAFHSIFQKFGVRALKNVTRHLASSIDPEHQILLAQHLQRFGYDPKSPSFHEEMINGVRDYLTNPTFRASFKDTMEHIKINPDMYDPAFMRAVNHWNPSEFSRAWNEITQKAREVTPEFLKPTKVQKSEKKPAAGQFHVDFTGVEPLTHRAGGFITWELTKPQLKQILDGWEETAKWEYRSPSRDTKENTFHATARARTHLSAPLAKWLEKRPHNEGRALYHGIGRDEVGADALHQTGMKIDKYDPHHPDPSYHTLPNRQYDQVHSHYTLNVVDRDQGHKIVQQIHDLLKDNGKAVISVRRDFPTVQPARGSTEEGPAETKALPTGSEESAKLLHKSDDKIQNIIEQAKPTTGTVPKVLSGEYGKRFDDTKVGRWAFTGRLQLNPQHYDKINSYVARSAREMTHDARRGLRAAEPALYHHVGISGNHTTHVLSRSADPTKEGIATIMTAKGPDKKAYVRAAYTNSIGDEALRILTDRMKSQPDWHTDSMVKVGANNLEKGWEQHNPDLIEGIQPDKTLQSSPETLSRWISFAGVEGDETPRVLVKAALKYKPPTTTEIKEAGKYAGAAEERIQHFVKNPGFFNSFYHDPNFSSAHREAAYQRVADSIFGLGQYVPRTTVFRHPLTNEPWSAMEFIKGARRVHDHESQLKRPRENGDLHKLAIMNMILGNNDRHDTNYMVDSAGQLKLIDHGITFDYSHVGQNPLPHYATDIWDKKIPESVHRWLWDIDQTKLANVLKDSGAPHDLVLIALGRLADAREWSKSVHMGSKLFRKRSAWGLNMLQSILSQRRLGVDPDDLKEKHRELQAHVLDLENKQPVLHDQEPGAPAIKIREDATVRVDSRPINMSDILGVRRKEGR